MDCKIGYTTVIPEQLPGIFCIIPILIPNIPDNSPSTGNFLPWNIVLFLNNFIWYHGQFISIPKIPRNLHIPRLYIFPSKHPAIILSKSYHWTIFHIISSKLNDITGLFCRITVFLITRQHLHHKIHHNTKQYFGLFYKSYKCHSMLFFLMTAVYKQRVLVKILSKSYQKGCH